MGIWATSDDLERCRRALLDAAPAGLFAEPLGVVGEGWASIALQDAVGMLALVGKNEMAARARLVSTSLLPRLAPTLPLSVPIPLWSINSAPGLDFGAFAYQAIPGRALPVEASAYDPDRIGRQLGPFLASLHAFSVEQALELGVPSAESYLDDFEALCEEIAPFLRGELTAQQYERMRAWCEWFIRMERTSAQPRVLLHGDFWWENVLVNEAHDRVVGVIDLGDAMVGDCAQDFARLRLSSQSLMHAAIQSYVAHGGLTGPDFQARLDRYWAFNASCFHGVRAALRADDGDQLAEEFEMLRRSPALDFRA